MSGVMLQVVSGVMLQVSCYRWAGQVSDQPLS